MNAVNIRVPGELTYNTGQLMPNILQFPDEIRSEFNLNQKKSRAY